MLTSPSCQFSRLPEEFFCDHIQAILRNRPLHLFWQIKIQCIQLHVLKKDAKIIFVIAVWIILQSLEIFLMGKQLGYFQSGLNQIYVPRLLPVLTFESCNLYPFAFMAAKLYSYLVT